jgi:hypothetical protein
VKFDHNYIVLSKVEFHEYDTQISSAFVNIGIWNKECLLLGGFAPFLLFRTKARTSRVLNVINNIW